MTTIYLIRNSNSLVDSCREQIKGNARLVLVSCAAAAIFIVISALWRRLNHLDIIPFDHWTVSLRLSQQTTLTDQEVQNLERLCETYTPTEFARRLHAYVLQNRTFSSKTPAQLESYPHWLQWISSNSSSEFSGKARPILPSYRERFPLTLEDEKASFIQTWTMSLQPFFALIKGSQLQAAELFQLIQVSPRLAYTILFNCIAPFATQMIWEGVQDFLPTSIREIGIRYLEHKGKIALACLGLLALLYHRMNQEKGIITNLTENFALSHKIHKALDLIPSYSEGIHHVLRTIGMSSRGEPNANIIWYYPKHTHRTFVGQIGDVLAEITATGRIYEKSNLLAEFPQLKNLQIVQFNVKLFLTEYRDKTEVYRGWHENLKHLTKIPNTLVVFTEIDAIKPYLIPGRLNSSKSDDFSEYSRGGFSETTSEKILSDLIALSLQKGTFRCLIELDEKDKEEMARNNQKMMHLFSAIRAPDINIKELEKLCERLYTAPDISCAFAIDEISNLFRHMSSFLEINSIPPEEIMETIQIELKALARSWRQNVNPAILLTIEQAELHLNELQEIKEQILQKLWTQRRQQQPESESLLQSLLLVEHILLPIYRKKLDELKKPYLIPAHLVDQAQKRFMRLLGPCSSDEENRLLKLPEKLKKDIKGQDAAMDALSKAVLRWRKIPPRDGKPLVLFFAGPPGVGKSETATRLAFELNFAYGIEESAIKTHESNVKRINLNRNKQGGSFGWDMIKNEILSHLLHAPTSVIILEEWDKMSEEEKSSLLELLDGTQNYMQQMWFFSNPNGPYVDKSCATFILTANIATDPHQNPLQNIEFVKQGIKGCFQKEKAKDAQAFLNRIDEVISFNEISSMAADDLIQIYLNEYEAKKILPNEKRSQVLNLLSALSNKPTNARDLQREVQKAIFEILKLGDCKGTT